MITKVYTKIKGKLAVFDVDTEDTQEAIKEVRDHLKLKHKKVILAMVTNPDKSYLAFDPII